MKFLLLLNLQTFVSCLGRLCRAPLPTFFTVACVGVILSLPTGLYMLSINIDSVAGTFQSTPELTIFIAPEASDQSVKSLNKRVSELEQVEQVRMVSADEALEEFKEITGLESIIEYMPENPLPTTIIVQPYEAHSNPSSIEELARGLRELDFVDAVEVDLEWLRRLYSIIGLVNIVSGIVSALLILAAILLICNTTRLSISSRLNEILVIDQIGGTRSFIRKPFVYTAVMQSLLGVAVAVMIVEGLRLILSEPVLQLATLYNSNFRFSGLPWTSWLGAAASVALLSWLAARITVYICLRHLEASKS